MLVLKIVVLFVVFSTGESAIKTKKLEDLANLTKLININRIRRLMRRMSEMAPRPVGSVANEELTVNFLMNELQEIKKVARSKSHFFSITVQRSKGSFSHQSFQRASSFPNVYEDIQNIIVRVGPIGKQDKNNSLLINAHFDTEPGSLAASESSANCVVMLEALRVIVHRHTQLEGFVIFLFNGASKTGLQGAHAFITKFRKAKDVKAFIDLQAMGAGGQQLLYQAGPDHAWQVTAYSTAATSPFGSIIAQEIFHSGLVPSETDYRVIKDFGHIPGIGLAYIENGYVYGTKFDTDDLLSDDDLKISAETLLNIVSYILRSPYLKHPFDLRNGKVVYFDMFGLFIVAYSQDRAFVINECIAVLVLLELIFKIKKARHQEGPKSKEVTKRLVITACSIIGIWGATIGLSSLLGFIMGSSSYGLSWYRNPGLIFGLYICPAIAFLISLNCLATIIFKKCFLFDSTWELENIFFDATRLIWAIMLFALTRATVKSAFLLTAWLLFPTLIRSLPAYLCMKKEVKYFSLKMIGIYVSSMIIPMAMTIYMSRLIYIIIIPALGRVGASVNPDVIIAFTSSILVILCMTYLTTLVHVAVQHAWKCLPVLISAFLITVIIVVTSNVGFPYTIDDSFPVPQKYIIQHIYKKDAIKSSSSYWIIPLDHNGPENLFEDVQELKKAVSISPDCDTKAFCDVPMLIPDFSMYSDSYILNNADVDEPNSNITGANSPSTQCTLEMIDFDMTRIYFSISGPDHMSMQLKINQPSALTRWSLEAFIAEPSQIIDDAPVYFLHYARGSTTSRSSTFKKWLFWIEIFHLPENITNAIEFSISRHYLHGNYSQTNKFKKFLSSFPFWTHVTSWTSTYHKYQIHHLC